MLIRAMRALVSMTVFIGSVVAVLVVPQTLAQASEHWTGSITMTHNLSTGSMVGEREVTYTIDSAGFPAALAVYTERQERPSNCPTFGGNLTVGEGEGSGTVQIVYTDFYNNPGEFEWYVAGKGLGDGLTEYTSTSFSCAGGLSTRTFSLECCMSADTPFAHRPIPTGVTDPTPNSIQGTYVFPADPDYVYTFAFGNDVNQPPVAVDDPDPEDEDQIITRNPYYSHTLEGLPIDVIGNDFDPDGDPITLTSYTQGTHGSVACTSEGSCTYTPSLQGGTDEVAEQIAACHGSFASSFERMLRGKLLPPDCDGGLVTGFDTFQYTISDGRGGLDSATVLITFIWSMPCEAKVCGDRTGVKG